MPGVLSARGPVAQPASIKPARRTINKERNDFLFINLLRYWIKSALIKWITAYYSFYTHPSTFQCAVLVYCLVGVMRTGWIKPTGIRRQCF